MSQSTKIRYPFENHVIFAKVMGNQSVCQEFIQRLFTDRKVTDVKDLEVTDPSTETTIIPGVYSRSVRFDVLFGDDASWYNIEMQVTREKDLPQRGRYYSAALDIAHLEKGKRYEKLKQSFIIFVCRFDYYEMDEAIYTFERYDKKLQLPYSDGSYIILLNTKCSEEKVPEELRTLFRYINTEEVAEGDEFVEKIHELVVGYQNDKEVHQIMTLEEEYIRAREIAIENACAEGLAEGRAQGLEKGRAEGLEKGRAEGLEKGRAEGLAQGREEGIAQGREEGVSATTERLNKLTTLLLSSGRIAELKMAAEDRGLQEQLLKEFGL